jgi:hypothetical protein
MADCKVLVFIMGGGGSKGKERKKGAYQMGQGGATLVAVTFSLVHVGTLVCSSLVYMFTDDD